jgi:hypothetical protein
MTDTMRELELLSVAALLEDTRDHQLLRGQVGTVVEQPAPGVYEVEFCDDGGRTYASLSLRADQLLQLHHEPNQSGGLIRSHRIGDCFRRPLLG